MRPDPSGHDASEARPAAEHAPHPPHAGPCAEASGTPTEAAPATEAATQPAPPARPPSPRIDPRAAATFFEDLRRILSQPRPADALRVLLERGVLQEVAPELVGMVGVEQPAKSHGCDAFEHTMRVVDAARADSALITPGDMELMLAALFHDVGKPHTKGVDAATGRITFHGHQFVGERLTRKRLKSYGAARANISAERVSRLVRHHMFDLDIELSEKAIRRFARKLGGPEMTYKLLDLRIADKRGGARPDRIGAIITFRKRVRGELERKEPFGLRDLAVNGHDLMEAGVAEGPQLGITLKRLLAAVLENPDLNNRDALLALALETTSDPCCD